MGVNTKAGWVRLSGVLLLLGLVAEGGSRVVFSGLPSLSPLREAHRVSGPGEPAWIASVGEGDSFRFLAVGDSVTLGVGLAREENYAWRMAEGISGGSRRVEVANVGRNAAGFQENLAVLEAQADADWDLVVLQVFGDDAERLPFREVGGVLVAYPSAVEKPWLRGLLRHSHAFNLLWWKLANRAWSRGSSDFSAAAYVDTPKEVFDTLSSDISAVRERIEARGGKLMIFLLPPAGAPRCEGLRPESRAEAECAWLLRELEQVHGSLVGHGVPVADLRDIYDEGGPFTQPEEVAAAQERQRVAVHPDAAGQARIAERLLSGLQLGED